MTESTTLPSDYQSFIHRSRYARFVEDKGRREYWSETVARYFDYFEESLNQKHGYKVPSTLRSELQDAVLGLNVMPSMRALMTAGPAAERENIAVYNCAYLPIDRPRAFAEVLYILMCGTGVGFSVERQIIAQLPEIPHEFTSGGLTIVVGDSKMGWADAFEQLVINLYAGRIPTVDYSGIRPAGEPLKVFGGRASGPDPLRKLFEFTTRMFHGAAGRRLNSLEVHEIVTMSGETVIVGGVRRSAEISLSNLSDQRMRDAKSGNWWADKPHLGVANNSVAYTEKPEVGSFMDEWRSLYHSRSGERGIFNRYGAVQKMLRLGRRDHRFEFGTNPCVTGATKVLTRSGYHPIRDLVGKSVEIWNGESWSSVTPFSTGRNPLVQVEFSDGTDIECTPYHRFVVQDDYVSEPYKVEARNLATGTRLAKFDMPIIEGGIEYSVDAYSQGFFQGDGTKNQKASHIYEPKMVCAERLVGEVGSLTKYRRARWKHGEMLGKGFVPLDGSLRFRRDWFAGLMDADGTVIRDKGNALQLCSIDLEFLKRVRLLLTTMGVQAKLGLMKSAGKMEGGASFDGYHAQACWRLCINQADTFRLMTEVGVTFERLEVSIAAPQRDARRFVTVAKVIPLERVEETFCFTDPIAGRGTFNGIVTANCGEIILRPRGLCNLTEIIARRSDGIGDLREKARLAAILGTWQSTQTDFNFVERDWQVNAEEERLLGVSITGIYDNPILHGDGAGGLMALGRHLTGLKESAIKTNRMAAHEIGISPSVAVTTVKPSGTVSQLVGCTSGIHPARKKRYLRRVQGDNKDPLTQFMRDAGIPHVSHPEPEKSEKTTIFSFPVEVPADTPTLDQVSALDHMKLVACYNRHWSEHAISCTISVREHEWPAVGGWVYDHFDDIAGMSFLPHFTGDTGYCEDIIPELAVSAERFRAEQDRMPAAIAWSDLEKYEAGEDYVTGTREFACLGNACEIADASTPL